MNFILKLFCADGGKDVRAALELSGETQISGALVGRPEDELTVYENWQLNAQRRDFALKYVEKWNKSVSMTKTGRPVDGLLSPIHPLPCYPTDFRLSAGYTAVINLLQLSSVIVPVTRVDPRLDQQHTEAYRTRPVLNELDENHKKFYESPEQFENCPIGLQVICRRSEEEKALGMAMVFEKALQSEFYSK